jgi:hypothetical protein
LANNEHEPMQQRPLYSGRVFKRILDLADEGLQERYRCRKEGAWLKETDSEVLNWSPACDADWEGSPDPLSTPAVPFPFHAGWLAAWMLDGWGSFAQERFGAWADGPDEEVLSALGGRQIKVREALRGAYVAYRSAEALVGHEPEQAKSVLAEANRLYRAAEARARARYNWCEQGVDEQELERRRRLFLRAVDLPQARLRAASAAETVAHADWRRRVVKHLLGLNAKLQPPSRVLASTAHEQAILAKLKELGHEPKALPRALPGKPSQPKREARDALRLSEDVFKKAWQRLLNSGEIKLVGR